MSISNPTAITQPDQDPKGQGLPSSIASIGTGEDSSASNAANSSQMGKPLPPQLASLVNTYHCPQCGWAVELKDFRHKWNWVDMVWLIVSSVLFFVVGWKECFVSVTLWLVFVWITQHDRALICGNCYHKWHPRKSH